MQRRVRGVSAVQRDDHDEPWVRHVRGRNGEAGGTAMVGAAPAIQACSRCATGKYKTGTSASDCVGCTNKDQNSVYTAWAVDATPSTNTCPW